MRDVQLWWRLHDTPGPDLLEALGELAKLSMRERAPFLGLVAPLLSHAEPGLRRAAIEVLAGARGIVGLRAVVDALNDPDAAMRAAAVASLREIATHEPVRWAHAIFHPRADVRAAALRGEVPDACAHYGAYLRADPETRALAEARPFPKPGLGLLLGLWRRRAIAADDAATLLGAVSPGPLREWIRVARRRSAAWIRGFSRLALAGPTLPPIVGADAFDGWVEIVAHASPAAAMQPLATMVEAVLAGKLADAPARLAVAVVQVGTSVGFDDLPDSLLGLAAACEPRLLGMRGLGPAVRRRAATALLRWRHRAVRPALPVVEGLLASDLVARPDGSPDLTVAVAIVGLLPKDRLAAVVRRFGEPVVVKAILKDLAGWAALCELPDESTPWSTTLLSAAVAHDEATGIALTAIALGCYAMHDHGALDRTIEAAAPIGQLLVEIVVQAQAGLLRAPPTVLGRLGHKLATRAYLGELSQVFEGLVGRLAHEPKASAVAMLGAVSAACDADDFALAIAMMPEYVTAVLVAECGTSLIVPERHEVALAEALMDADEPSIATWVANRRLATPTTAVDPTRSGDARALGSAEQDAIALASPGELAAALLPALVQPVTGLVEALERRPAATEPHLDACVALLACGDALPAVAALVDQWHDEGPAFAEALRRATVDRWMGLRAAPWLAQAWMHPHERHAFAMLARIDATNGGLLGVLQMVDALPGAVARRHLWEALASVMTLRRYRERAKLVSSLTSTLDALLVHLIGQLDTDVGASAAKLLVCLHLGGLNVAGARKQVLARAPDMDREAIHELARFVRVDGFPIRTTAARQRERSVAEQRLVQIRRECDLDALQSRCRSSHPKVVLVAAQRLVELGTIGERRLAALLAEQPPVRGYASIAQTLGQWHDPDALAVVRRLIIDASTPAQMQYRLAMAMHRRGERGWMVALLKALRVPTDQPWFGRGDWGTLLACYRAPPRGLALELTDACHPHVYRNAMELLLAAPIDDEALAAFRRFLAQGSLRPADLRRAAAKHLNDHGDPFGLPVLMTAITDLEKGWDDWLFTPPTPELASALAELLLAATLYGGPHACDEARLLILLQKLTVPRRSADEVATRLLTDARNPKTCQSIVQARGPRAERMFKIFDIADIFAWGVRRGRELTGRLFRVHMTWRRGDYGHTYLDSNSIHVTPLPVLRGDRDGRDVVEALILHEFGHHMYHKGPDKESVWKRATGEGLGHLFNLVADEHLERNLRALRPEYGDRLKRLASFAFQHNDREMEFDGLLGMLGASAFDALGTQPLGVAYDARCIRIHSGDLLRELERVGNPFARFVRALRQGLGNRHDDPIVEEALGLFRDRFRHSDMEALYGITKRLQELFGIDAQMASQIGGHETIKGTGREAALHGEDIDDDEVQREVERILDPRQLDRMRAGSDGGGKPGKLAVNVIDDDSFKKITDIVRVAPDPEKHRKIAIEVRRHADRVRRYFEEMGLNYVPQRARMRGRAFDRTRARAVVLRRDPRMLVAREMCITTDLFIGVVIDCSGSMRTSASMDKAHRFGVLLAEAVRGLSNVEARFFGFTDKVIYDAGDERQCAVAALETGGGNNDAAALYHAAQAADRSRRRSKLLVMISDGLPTECSAVALRQLAQKITRRQGIVCAQVAVRPLSEVCFPHYVEIKPGDHLDVAVRRFGEIVSGLAKRALGR